MFGLSVVKILVWLMLICWGIAAMFIASDTNSSQAKATMAVFFIVAGFMAFAGALGTAFFQWLI